MFSFLAASFSVVVGVFFLCFICSLLSPISLPSGFCWERGDSCVPSCTAGVSGRRPEGTEPARAAVDCRECQAICPGFVPCGNEAQDPSIMLCISWAPRWQIRSIQAMGRGAHELLLAAPWVSKRIPRSSPAIALVRTGGFTACLGWSCRLQGTAISREGKERHQVLDSKPQAAALTRALGHTQSLHQHKPSQELLLPVGSSCHTTVPAVGKAQQSHPLWAALSSPEAAGDLFFLALWASPNRD